MPPRLYYLPVLGEKGEPDGLLLLGSQLLLVCPVLPSRSWAAERALRRLST